jgi:GNAT superfamily N-acetyltransferase
MVEADVPAYTAMLKRSFNTWYRNHGLTQDFFQCEDHVLDIFWRVYSRISPGHAVAAFENDSGAILGACFYHPREHHVSLGIMAVAPECFGRGVGSQIVKYIIQFTESHGYGALRLVGSAGNMNSFSLYNRAGLVPRAVFQDMMLRVPETGMPQTDPLRERVRAARMQDVGSIKNLEMEISGICRENDYRFFIENPLGHFHASVIASQGGIGGFAASIRYPALNMIGPAFARSEEEMRALVLAELQRYPGEMALIVAPMEKRLLVESLYRWGAINTETHLLQVRGKFQPIAGVILPSYLPETG